MPSTLTDLAPMLPEIWLAAMACVVLVADVYVGRGRITVAYLLAQLSLLGALWLLLRDRSAVPVSLFDGAFLRDELADLLKLFVLGLTVAAFAYARGYLQGRGLERGEYFSLGLFGVLGMMVLISAGSLLTLYLGLELLALSLYAMVALHRDSLEASEAAMKYFVLGALASGMALYGISLLYGVTGSLGLDEVARAAAADGADPVMLLALAFVVVGVAFKLGAVPFHMWVPDVYHGAPAAVALYVGAAPKIAGFALAMRLLVEGLGGLQGQWADMLTVLAVLSLAVGNVVAIAQTNIKRMLGYSTISHMGFLLLGLLAGTRDGYGAAMFYALTYALMAAGAFGVVAVMSRGREAECLDDYRGLNARNPWLAFLMLVLMFSMAGVPPTVGFYAKLTVLKAVIDVGALWLAVLAVIFSVIGAFYYLRVVKLMYFDEPPQEAPVRAGLEAGTVLSINGLAVLGLGLLPGALLALCLRAVG